MKICTVNELFWFLVFKKSLNLSLFMKFVLLSKPNKDKSTEICISTPSPSTYCTYAHVQCREPKNVSKRFQIKEDDKALTLYLLLLYGRDTVRSNTINLV